MTGIRGRIGAIAGVLIVLSTGGAEQAISHAGARGEAYSGVRCKFTGYSQEHRNVGEFALVQLREVRR